MVENIYRELGLRYGTEYKLSDVILAAAKDVDRPIFYSVAVIIAGYLPIYALTGPAGKLFHPMADTMGFALLGALILTLTVVPGARVVLVQTGRKGKAESHVQLDSRSVLWATRMVPESSGNHHCRVAADLWRHAAADPADRRRIPAASG